MDKKKLLDWFQECINRNPDLTEADDQDLEAITAIRSLISAHGGEAEVGDFTEQTLAWFNSLVRWAREHDRAWHEGDDEAVKFIRAILRQPRTVSRGKIYQIAERLMTTALRHSTTDLATDLAGELAELGIQIKEPKKGGEES